MEIVLPVRHLDPSIPLKKHTAVIHFKGQLLATDHKLLNIIYKCAYVTDNFCSEEYCISLNAIIDIIGWKKNKFDDVLASLKVLKDASFEWNIFEQDFKNKTEWKEVSSLGFISEFHISKITNSVTFSIGPAMRRLLQQPNIYTLIDLNYQKNLKGKFDLVMYEYFIEELYRKKSKKIISRWYSVTDIRRMLNLNDEHYKEFKEFSRSCIKEPINSITEHTDLTITISDIERVCRKVVAYKFELSFKDISGADVSRNTTLDDEEFSNYDILKELTLYFGLESANKLISEIKAIHPTMYLDLIRSNIEYAKRKNIDGKVVSLTGFIRTAIINDYSKYIETVKNEIEIKEKKLFDIESQKVVKQEEQKVKEKYERYEVEFNSLSENEMNELYSVCRSNINGFDKRQSFQKKLDALSVYFKKRECEENV